MSVFYRLSFLHLQSPPVSPVGSGEQESGEGGGEARTEVEQLIIISNKWNRQLMEWTKSCSFIHLSTNYLLSTYCIQHATVVKKGSMLQIQAAHSICILTLFCRKAKYHILRLPCSYIDICDLVLDLNHRSTIYLLYDLGQVITLSEPLVSHL
jgi:hypothetical protein